MSAHRSRVVHDADGADGESVLEFEEWASVGIVDVRRRTVALDEVGCLQEG